MERPALPPSLAQAHAIDEFNAGHFTKSIKKLLRDSNYILLLITYGNSLWMVIFIYLKLAFTFRHQRWSILRSFDTLESDRSGVL